MKKLLLSLVMVFATMVAAHAQFGIVGGWTSSKSPVGNTDAVVTPNSLFHVGVTYKIGLGPFFAIQPTLAYQVKGSDVEIPGGLGGTIVAVKDVFHSRGNYVELGAGLQLGIDLLALRPFILFEPFVGYDVSSVNKASLYSVNAETVDAYLNDAKNKFEYGFGVGGGLELLRHFQVSVQWFMNGGKLYNADKLSRDAVKGALLAGCKDIKNYQGVKVTLGILF